MISKDSCFSLGREMRISGDTPQADAPDNSSSAPDAPPSPGDSSSSRGSDDDGAESELIDLDSGNSSGPDANSESQDAGQLYLVQKLECFVLCGIAVFCLHWKQQATTSTFPSQSRTWNCVC